MVWAHRSLGTYRWHCPVTPSSPQSPFVHPPPYFLNECTQQTVLRWKRDSVELEAKGQASAQITTGAIVIRDKNEEKKMDNFS